MDRKTLKWGVWNNDRSSLEGIEAALAQAESAAAHAVSGATSNEQRAVSGGAPTNVVPLRGVAPAAARTARTKSMVANAKSGMEQWRWVDALCPADIDEMVQAIAADPAMRPLADSDRTTWLRVLFGFAAFETPSGTTAQDAARAWSKTSPRYSSDDFDSDWQSFDPERPDGITAGTLIYHAKAVGIDLEPWRERARTSYGDVASAAGPQIPRGAPLSQMPPIMDEAQARDHLNARFFKAAQWGKAPSFGSFDSDGSVRRLKPEDLNVELAGNFVVSQAAGKPRRIPAAKWWVDNPKKVAFDRVLYDPEGKRARAGETSLNLWAGFAVQPKRGTWRRMLRHIWRVICGRDRGAFKYFIRWLAFCVQFPGTNPEVMIVLRSDVEGVGKSSVGVWLLKIFDKHGFEVTNYKMVFGDFNELIEAKSFILLEEPVFPGNHQAAGILKAMTTAREITINPKGARAYSIPNTMHVMMATNGKWAIPAGAEARRFLMLDVEEKMDRAYFDALWKEAENGGIEAMLFDLLRVDLSQFDRRQVPITNALIDQQERSADSIAQWIADSVYKGEVISQLPPPQPGGGFGSNWSTKELYGSYQHWCISQGTRHVETIVVFGRALGKMGLTRGKSNNPPKWYIPDPVTLQAASDKRSGIRRP